VFSFAEIAERAGGRLLEGDGGTPRRVVHDSRLVEDGDLFVALPGARTDGHDYLAQAFARGAGGALVSRQVAIPGGRNLILVPETLSALQRLASAWREGLPAVLVGVTGTCGKTTTKLLLAHLLAGDREAFAAPESYNTEVGLPLALLAMPLSAAAGVFELGTSAPGEIAPLARLLAPRVGVVTLVGRGHLEGFGSVAAVVEEKWDLVRALPEDGLAVVNADCPLLAERARAWRGRISTVGVESGTFRGRVEQASPRLVLRVDDPPLSLSLPLLGAHNATNVLAAAACAHHLGVSPETIERRVESFSGAPHRLALLPAPFGHVLDDTYNANPESMAAALRFLAEVDLPLVRRGFVFGEMLELGEDADRCHDEVLTLALRLGASPIYPVGDGATRAAERALGKGGGRGIVLSSREDLPRRVQEDLARGPALLLVKGSHALRLDELVERLVCQCRTCDVENGPRT
jgi:UDP-N-acetylmuramoyl-tripeptide--D-alanyl-D-alanine ligase